LFFLNSPLVRECSSALADRLLALPGNDSVLRLREAHLLALGRPPSPAETDRAMRFIRAAFQPEASDAERRAWVAWCQVLLASNEFLYRD
jgi:hypothetical protein